MSVEKKVNKTALISITVIEVLLIFALLVQTFAVKTSYGKMGILRTVIWQFKDLLFSGSNVAFISVVVNFEIIIVIHTVAKLSERFSYDMTQSVRDEQKAQSKMVEDINSKIGNLVESNNGIIDNIHQLTASSEQVSSSAKEVEEHSLKNKTEAEKAKHLLSEVGGLVEEFEKYKNKND